MEQIRTLTEFAKDTLKGLSANPKYLLSKYFYDEQGCQIFSEIMRMPEYYLTDCEEEIFNTHKKDIYAAFIDKDPDFVVIDLGAGDGFKTKILLSFFAQQNINHHFIPVDISLDSIRILEKDIKTNIPGLKVSGRVGDYFKLVEVIGKEVKGKKILFFLGSNIGNFTNEESIVFLEKLRSVMLKEDQLFIGFDMKKDSDVILQAYDDPHGNTAAFNRNHLRRINDELKADFDLNQFRHHETYDPVSGAAKSHLLSLKSQKVHIGELNQTFEFLRGEPILMEISQKYDMDMIKDLADKSGFEIVRNYYDSRQFFVNSLWKIYP